MRRRSTRNPFVSFCLFLILCSMGWVAWEYREELRSNRAPERLDSVLREQVEEVILREFELDSCFVDVRGGLNWRPNERRFRLDILLEDSAECEDRAREICKRIAERIQLETELAATVVAFDAFGRELGRCVL